MRTPLLLLVGCGLILLAGAAPAQTDTAARGPAAPDTSAAPADSAPAQSAASGGTDSAQALSTPVQAQDPPAPMSGAVPAEPRVPIWLPVNLGVLLAAALLMVVVGYRRDWDSLGLIVLAAVVLAVTFAGVAAYAWGERSMLPATIVAAQPGAAAAPWDARPWLAGAFAIALVLFLGLFVAALQRNDPLIESHWAFGGGGGGWRVAPAVMHMVVALAFAVMLTVLVSPPREPPPAPEKQQKADTAKAR